MSDCYPSTLTAQQICRELVRTRWPFRMTLCVQRDSWTFVRIWQYSDVIMGAMASQITSLKIVYSAVYSGRENIKSPRHWPLWVEFTGDRWIPRKNGQLRGKCFHLMMSSWERYINFVISTAPDVSRAPGTVVITYPWGQGSWGQRGAHLGPTGPRWATCRPNELCYLGCFLHLEIRL